MNERYHGFQDLPAEVVEKLRKLLVACEESLLPKFREDDSIEERIQAIEESCRDIDYTEEELVRIAEAFTLVNNAVSKGLPNQFYQMLTKVLDTGLAKRAYARHAIWYAHEGDESAKEAVKRFADMIKAEIDKRADWDEGQFHNEYFLNRE